MKKMRHLSQDLPPGSFPGGGGGGGAGGYDVFVLLKFHSRLLIFVLCAMGNFYNWHMISNINIFGS